MHTERLVVCKTNYYSSHKTTKTMGVLKLSVIEERNKQFKMKIASNEGQHFHVGMCDCPCWAFLKKGEVIMEDVSSTASWNID